MSNAVRKEIATLMRNHVIVVWDGANDIGKNESSKGLSRTSSFIKSR
jgi:hypothetical protein